MSERKPIEPAAIEHMRSILAKIKSGEYKHNQDAWHCGTAHCFVGWLAVEETAKQLNQPKLFTADFQSGVQAYMEVERHLESYPVADAQYNYLWGYNLVYAKWGLTKYEYLELVNDTNSIDQLEEMVELFAAGQRDFDIERPDGDGDDDYDY